jgi:hypothetical protein
MIKNKRIGKVLIATDIIENKPEVIHLLFSKFIPLRAEMMWHEGHIEYIGISELFDEREEGCVTPQYDVIIDQDESGVYKISKVEKMYR